MHRTHKTVGALLVGSILAGGTASALAQDAAKPAAQTPPPATTPPPAAKPATPPPAPAPAPSLLNFRGLSNIYNVREANPNTTKGQWQIENNAIWTTSSNGTDDDLFMNQSIRYGLTDAMFIELGVNEPNIGDGGNSGAGDLNVAVFYRCIEETDTMPAFGSYAVARIPSGDGSSKIDVKLQGSFTKTFDRLRVHMQGFVASLNGHVGAASFDREYFQWGAGPGIDYQLDDGTLLAVNYTNQNNEVDGAHNQNVLQFGVSKALFETESSSQYIIATLDVGLDGNATTPNMGARLEYGITIK